MCFSFTPCYFAIIHIKYKIIYKCPGWRHMYSLECCLYSVVKRCHKQVLLFFDQIRIGTDTVQGLNMSTKGPFFKTLPLKTGSLQRKRKRSDSVLCIKPRQQQKNPKSNVKTQNHRQKVLLYYDCGPT